MTLELQVAHDLRSWRKIHGLTLDEVAERVGMSSPMIGNHEKARSSMTLRTLQRIANGLELDVTITFTPKK